LGIRGKSVFFFCSEFIINHPAKLQSQIEEKREKIKVLQGKINDWEVRQADMESSMGWKMMVWIRKIRLKITPLGSRRDKWLYKIKKEL